MPAERDRIFGELAVEQGLIAREDAVRYWRMLDATPNAPPLAQLLVRDGRATPQDIDRLRALWQSRQSGAVPRPPVPGPAPMPAPPGPNGRATGSFAAQRPAPPPPFATAAGPPPIASAPPPPAPFNAPPPAPAALDPAALKRDEILARILVARNALTVDRARDARNQQIQQRSRLSPLLAKLGWVDRARLDEAIRFVREQVLACGRCFAPQDRSRVAPGAPCPACGGPLGPVADDFSLSPPLTAASPMSNSALIRPAAPPGRQAPPGFPQQWGPPPGIEPESATFRSSGPQIPPGLDDPFASARADVRGFSPQPNPNDPRALFDPMRAPGPPGAMGGPPRPGPGAFQPQSLDELDPFSAAPASQDPRAFSAAPASQDPRAFSAAPASQDPRAFSAAPPPAPPGRPGAAPPLQKSVDELDPFSALGGPPRPAAAPMQDFGGLSQEELNPFANVSLQPPPVAAPLGIGDSGEPAAEAPGLDLAEPDAPAAEPEAPPLAAPGAEDAEEDAGAKKSGKGKKPLRGKKQTNFTVIESTPAKSSGLGKVVGLLVVLAVLGVAGVGGFLAWKAKAVQDALVVADAAFDKKDWSGARDAYLKVLDLDKQQARAIQRKGECERKLDEDRIESEVNDRLAKARAASSPEEALRALGGEGSTLPDPLKERVATSPAVQAGLSQAKRRQALQLLEQGKKDDAARALEEASKAVDAALEASRPPSPVVLLERIRLLDARHVGALELDARLKELGAADPSGWIGLYARSRQLFTSVPARADEVIADLDKVLEKAGDPALIPEALWVRACAKLRAKKGGSKDDLDKAIRADPDEYRYHVELAKIALDVDKSPDEAGRLIAKIEKRAGSDADALAVSAEVAFRQKRLDDAEARAGEALKANPGQGRARKVRALVALAKKATYADHLVDLNTAVSEFPDDPLCRLERGNFLLGRKQFLEAIADFDFYTKLVGFDADVARKRSQAYAEGLRDFEKAIGELDAILDKEPKNGAVYAERGALHLARKVSSKAIEDFTKASELLQGKELAPVIYQRGVAYHGAGKWKEALDDFERYLKDWPDGPDAAQATKYRNECRQKVGK